MNFDLLCDDLIPDLVETDSPIYCGEINDSNILESVEHVSCEGMVGARSPRTSQNKDLGISDAYTYTDIPPFLVSGAPPDSGVIYMGSPSNTVNQDYANLFTNTPQDTAIYDHSNDPPVNSSNIVSSQDFGYCNDVAAVETLRVPDVSNYWTSHNPNHQQLWNFDSRLDAQPQLAQIAQPGLTIPYCHESASVPFAMVSYWQQLMYIERMKWAAQSLY